jgi:hypothetical protein
VLQGKFRVGYIFLRWGLIALVGCTVSSPADRGIVPYSVCEIVRDLPSHDGQSVAVVGRYSFRTNGRWVSQQGCQGASGAQAEFRLVEDLTGAPKPPDVFELDASELDKRLAEVQQRTVLGKFRFGSLEYDRWAVIYGRLEARKGEDAKTAAANLVIRGNAMIIFLPRP